MVRVERAQVPLASRLAGHVGADLAVTLAGGLRLHGALRHVGRGWISLAAGPVEYVVPDAALRAVEGPGARATPEPSADASPIPELLLDFDSLPVAGETVRPRGGLSARAFVWGTLVPGSALFSPVLTMSVPGAAICPPVLELTCRL